jgi:phosphatidate cytidylyltransferase
MHLDSEAPDEAENTDAARRRSRAADLFSTDRYRQLQVKLFERLRDSGFSTAPEDTHYHDDNADSFDPIVRNTDSEMTEVGGFAPIPNEHGDTWAHDVAAGEVVGAASGEVSVVTPMSGTTPYAPPDAENPADAEPLPNRKRDMRAAAIVGFSLLGLMLFTAWWHPLAFAIVVYGFCIAAAVEWSRALKRQGRRIPLIPIIAAIVGMGIATWYAKPEGLVVALLVGGAGVVAWRLSDERIENTLADSMAAMLTLMWIPFLASFVVLLELAEDGWIRVLIFVFAVAGNDTGGLFFGSKFGKRKLLPRVSPSKTWEGFAGGVIVGTSAATVAAFFLLDGRWYIGATVGLACTLAAVIGDLAESAIKRDIDIKDMSSALPGHGGILDRLDSMVFAAPVAYVVFALFLGTLGSL